MAINVPAKLGLRSKALTFKLGTKVPISPIPIVKLVTANTLSHPEYDAATIPSAGPTLAEN